MKRTILMLMFAGMLTVMAGCQPAVTPTPRPTHDPFPVQPTETSAGPIPTPLPEREVYPPGELVAYTAQTGDTIPALAARFNTTEEEILAANPNIPEDASTMPPGMPMQIPIYYRTFWGTPFKMIPDWHFVNGPAAVEFDSMEFAGEYAGWLNTIEEYAGGENRSGPEIIDLVAKNYSISPRVLIALSEYLGAALSSPTLPEVFETYPLRFRSSVYQGFYRQLLFTANILNNGYYEWREGSLLEITLADNTLERPDPWQNAATVSLQHLFSQIMPVEQYRAAISPEGFAATYHRLFSDPWADEQPHIPGSLTQPPMVLPFPAGDIWAHTGGPHTGWGSGAPYAAIDFAPASDFSGCYPSNNWVTAMADGVIARAEPGFTILDLDGDGDERTGWVIFYLHTAGRDQIEEGTQVKAGDQLGHPSCEGGSSTGTHVHLGRKYNGEWILAGGPVVFVMEGWEVHAGEKAYDGTLTRFGEIVNACECSTMDTLVQATGNYSGIPDTPLPTPTP